MLKYILLAMLVFSPIANAQNVWGDEEKKEAAVEDLNENLEEKVSTWTVEDVQNFVSSGFDINKKDVKGNTVLYYALSRNLSLDVAKKVIELGANVNEPAANGMLPINVATSKANELQLQVLMMKTMGLDMANPKIEAELEKNIFHEMRRMTKLAALLIDAGADVNKESVLGTPLMNAVTNRWNEEIINLLLKYGADVNKQDKNGRTALFYAFSSGNDDLVSLLIQAGANTEIKDNDGKTYMELERTEIR
ncbi:MAG TPA: hypothetical protein DIC64_03870 [Alphaproteobacteria bacterium]|nr:hypothetical protein [Alphaproteobacteria bacterium]